MEQPNYYAILPAQVRYDRKLKPNEKLLYAEITSLANKNGYCWASNSYFAELYGVHKNTVGAWIDNLVKRGYIHREIIRNEKKEIVDRRLYLSQSLIGINQIIDTPINQIIEDNNKHNNNKHNISENKFSRTQQQEETYTPVLKQSYKTKKKIMEQKGIKYTPPPKTPAQKKAQTALKAINTFRDKAMDLHGISFYGMENAQIRKMFKDAYDKIGGNYDDYLDWWFDAGGEWCGYKPQNVFSLNSINDYIIYKNKKQKSNDWTDNPNCEIKL